MLWEEAVPVQHSSEEDAAVVWHSTSTGGHHEGAVVAASPPLVYPQNKDAVELLWLCLEVFS